MCMFLLGFAGYWWIISPWENCLEVIVKNAYVLRWHYQSVQLLKVMSEYVCCLSAPGISSIVKSSSITQSLKGIATAGKCAITVIVKVSKWHIVKLEKVHVTTLKLKSGASDMERTAVPKGKRLENTDHREIIHSILTLRKTLCCWNICIAYLHLLTVFKMHPCARLFPLDDHLSLDPIRSCVRI